MMRSFSGRLITVAKRLVDDTVPAEKLHAFMRWALQDLATAVKDGKIATDEQRLLSIVQAVGRLRERGFRDLPSFPVIPRSNPAGVTVEDDRLVSPVVHQGRIDHAVVEALMLMVDRHQSLNEFQSSQLETLLRHVEVRRQAGLIFRSVRSEMERWGSVAQISVLFSRFAMRERDFRFLNAALKLNDWIYRHGRDSKRNSGFLLALLEAEATLMEMTV
jgi:hypothetical protein